MPTICRVITVVKPRAGAKLRFLDKSTRDYPIPGDMFYAPWMLKHESEETFAPRYLAIKSQRPPIVVVLPSGQWWCVDQRAFNSERGWYGEGWSVEGEIPDITCLPSINTHAYHGMLERGILSDDMGSHAP